MGRSSGRQAAMVPDVSPDCAQAQPKRGPAPLLSSHARDVWPPLVRRCPRLSAAWGVARILVGLGQWLQSNKVTAPSLFFAMLAILRVVFVLPNPDYLCQYRRTARVVAQRAEKRHVWCWQVSSRPMGDDFPDMDGTEYDGMCSIPGEGARGADWAGLGGGYTQPLHCADGCGSTRASETQVRRQAPELALGASEALDGLSWTWRGSHLRRASCML